jgi:hypothetical protein
MGRNALFLSEGLVLWVDSSQVNRIAIAAGAMGKYSHLPALGQKEARNRPRPSPINSVTQGYTESFKKDIATVIQADGRTGQLGSRRLVGYENVWN